MPMTIIEGASEADPLVRERQRKDRAERRLRELMREIRSHEESKRSPYARRDPIDDMLYRRARQILGT
jgi:hypothetical protein